MASTIYTVTGAGTDVAAQVQGYVDTIAASGTGGRIHFPGDVQGYTFGFPVYLDANNLTITGDGYSSALVGYPSLISGVSRKIGGTVFSEANHYADLFGIADATLVAGAGQKWGYNLHNDAYIALPASPFELGPIYPGRNIPDFCGNLDRLTIDFKAQANGSTWGAQRVCTMQYDGDARPRPFVLYTSGGSLWFLFTTNEGQYRAVSVPFTDATRLQFWSLQINFATGDVLAWVNKTQVAPNLSGLNGAITGKRFATNEDGEFQIGGTVSYGGVPGGADYTIVGLTFSSAAKYANDGVGQPQRRLDALTVNDVNTFYSAQSAADFAVLQQIQVGMAGLGGATGNHNLAPYTGTRGGFGLFLKNGWNTFDTIGDTTIRDVRMQSGADLYGAAHLTGACYRLRLQGCWLNSGAKNLCSLHTVVSYTTRLKDCMFKNSTDCGVDLNNSTVRIRDSDFEGYSRSGLRLHGCPNHVVSGCFWTDGNHCTHPVRLFRSPGLLEDAEIDFEDGSQPTDCYIYCSPSVSAGGRSNLTIRRASSGLGVAGIPYARLDGPEGNCGMPTLGGLAVGLGHCLIEQNSELPTSFSALVQTDSRIWLGEIVGIPADHVPVAVEVRGSDYPTRFGLDGVPAGFVLPAVSVNPLALSRACISWGRARDVSGTDGVAIATVPDHTGAGHPGAPTNNSVLYRAAVNGMPALQFLGTGQIDLAGVSGSTGGATVLFSTTPNGPGTGTGLFQSRSTIVTNGVLYESGGWNVLNSGLPFATTTPPQSDLPCVLALRVTETHPRVIEFWCNGMLADRRQMANNQPVTWSTPRIGQSNIQNWTGHLHDWLIYDGAVTDNELADLTRMLMVDGKVTTFPAYTPERGPKGNPGKDGVNAVYVATADALVKPRTFPFFLGTAFSVEVDASPPTSLAGMSLALQVNVHLEGDVVLNKTVGNGLVILDAALGKTRADYSANDLGRKTFYRARLMRTDPGYESVLAVYYLSLNG